jgi:hypothetical protein
MGSNSDEDVQRQTAAMTDISARAAKCACGQLQIVCEGAPEKVSACHCLHHFCPACGTTVFWYPARKAEQVAVAGGCFAERDFPVPTQQVYEHHRKAWVHLEIRDDRRS